MKNPKKYYINAVTHMIETYQVVCDHPNNSHYLIYLDSFEQPKRMLKIDYDKLKLYDDYEDAKPALIAAHKESIKYWSKNM